MTDDQQLLSRLREGMSLPRDPVSAQEAMSRSVEPRRRSDERIVRTRLSARPAIIWSVAVALLLVVLVVTLDNSLNRSFKPSVSSLAHKADRHLISNAGLSDHFELNAGQVEAGHSEVIYLVVVNPGKTVKIPQGCPPFFQVILQKGPLIVYPTNGLVMCAEPPFVIKHGTHRFPITVAASYDGCGQGPPYSINLPECGPSSSMPALPVGTYKITLQWLRSDFKPLPDPQPVSLKIVK